MDVFTAVADPTRRRMLDILRTGERSAGELGRAFPKRSQPGLSRHLRVLREAKLVRVRREEQRWMYSLAATPLAELDIWVSRYRGFWESRLDELEQYLDERYAATPTRRGKGRRTR